MEKVKPRSSEQNPCDLPGKKRCVLRYLSVFILAILIPATLIGLAAPASAQSSAATGTLRGQVTDPSGAVVTNATVAALVSGGQTHSVTTNRSGGYEIGNLAPGKYTVTANAEGFAVFVQNDVDVAAGQVAQFNISLDINVQKEKVNVQEETPQVDVNPASNASAIVLSGKDLEALPDDPDELQSDLEALAGPSAGPNGGQLYIDGFTGGQLPPKSSIREIRINQNPFSAEYDKLGYGRIEVFTKPGTDKFHGQFSVVGNSSGLNTRNPFLHVDPVTHADPFQPYDSVIYMGNIGGPINKKASFFFNVQRRNIDEVAVVNAQILDSNFQPTAFNASVPNPRTRTNLSPRLDYQISSNNTLTARYQYFHDTQQNAGVGQFALPSTGDNTSSSEHTVQISDTQILGTKAVNETRFEYERENSRRTPLSTALGISVPGDFTGGGSSSGAQTDHQDHYELQNYTSVSLGKHFVKFGGRLRTTHEVNASSAGFNGAYTFPDLTTYSKALQGLPNSMPSQFSINATTSGKVPTVDATVVDAGLYVQDDFRLRPNLTLSGGLRFETQNAIHDHGDFAPRIGLAWGIGGGGKTTAKTVLRAGYGLFYDRFGEELVLNANRMNGVTQQQYLVSAPDFFPLLPDLSSLTPQTQTIYQISPNLHAPYVMQSAVSLERQVTKIANVTVSYLNSRGVHQFVSLNVNAPAPGTPGSSGPPPFPDKGPIYQYSSDGVFRQNQLIANFNIRAGAKLSLFGYYSLNYANSDASGASSFPSDQYDLGADYGRASFDTRHRLFLGGTVNLPYAFRLSPFMIFNSGSPYNVTVGQDLNNDSVINDRPAFATTNDPNCVSLIAVCHYNPSPTGSDVLVPINYLTGPTRFTLNLRLAKTFGFGPEKGGKAADGGPGPGGPPGGVGGGGHGPGGRGGGVGRGGGGGPFGQGATTNRRYNLTLSVNARNLLNRVNAATPVGNLGSNFFGQSVALAGGPFSSAAANRRIELQAMFSF
jgi:Carboxypeptidase regulatory-like domain/TonB dependent receptor